MTTPRTAAGRAAMEFLQTKEWLAEVLAIEAEARAQVVAEYNEGPSGPALIPNGEPCPICGPSGHGGHEDDSYGSCVICYEYQPHTDMQYNKVAFPCAVVREAEARAAALDEARAGLAAIVRSGNRHRPRLAALDEVRILLDVLEVGRTAVPAELDANAAESKGDSSAIDALRERSGV